MNRRKLRLLYWNFRYLLGRGRGTSILRRQMSHLRTLAAGPAIIRDSTWGSMTIDLPDDYMVTSDRGERRPSLLAQGWITRDANSVLDLTFGGIQVLSRHLAIRKLYLAHLNQA